MGVTTAEAQAKVLDDVHLINCQVLVEQFCEAKHAASPRLEVLSRSHGQSHVLLPSLLLPGQSLCPAEIRPFRQGLGDAPLHEGNNAGVNRVVSTINAILAPFLADQVDAGVDPRGLAGGCSDGPAVDHDVGVGVGGGNTVAELIGHPGHGLHAACIDLRILLGAAKASNDLLFEAAQVPS